jgi:hypothetical protein
MGGKINDVTDILYYTKKCIRVDTIKKFYLQRNNKMKPTERQKYSYPP